MSSLNEFLWPNGNFQYYRNPPKWSDVGRPPMYQALVELGKVVRTIFLVNYMDDGQLRRQTLQLKINHLNLKDETFILNVGNYPIERQYLKALPNRPYELKDYKRAKVQKMGYVYLSPDKSYYSVPYRFIGKETQIHYTHSRIEVFHNHQRIALHQRNLVKGAYFTNTDHLSSTHKFYSDWNPEFFRQKAAPHGQHVLQCVEKILIAQDYPELGYKRALGVIQLYRAYGSQRLDQACKRALDTDACSYKRIKNILKKNIDKVPL